MVTTSADAALLVAMLGLLVFMAVGGSMVGSIVVTRILQGLRDVTSLLDHIVTVSTHTAQRQRN
jgi:hypothetical protein